MKVPQQQGPASSSKAQAHSAPAPVKGDASASEFQDLRPEATAQRQLSDEIAEANTNSVENNTGLPNQLKSGIENLSGHSLDDVRVHYNSGKPAQLNAHAYAQGADIHVASGQEKHLPHEAWHVVQQKQSRVRPTTQLQGVGINDDVGLETEADVMGAKALRTEPDSAAAQRPLQRAKNDQVQRQVILGAPRPSLGSTKAVLQRFQAQIIAGENKDGQTIIIDIKLSGRTPSPFGSTMGAHSTAWTVHVDAVRRQVQGLTLDQAIAKITELLVELAKSPQAAIASKKNPFGPGGGFSSAFDAAEKFASNPYKGKDDLLKAQWLEDYIHAYLDALNNAPLSTVRSGDTSGDGESEPRNFLIQIEGGQLKGAKAILIQESLGALFAKDTPSAFVKDHSFSDKFDPKDIWARALHGYIRAIKHAYPISYQAAGLSDPSTLSDFLKGLSNEVPNNIVKRINLLGEAGGKPSTPKNVLLQGGSGDTVGGDLAVQVRTDSKGNISDINFEGRTPSPFVGSMGAHSTAWVAHLDALRSALGGRSLTEAIGVLSSLVNEGLTSPLLNMIPFILPDQAKLLARSRQDLAFFIKTLTAKNASSVLIKSRLQQTLAAYLQFMNALPLHTAEAADTTGNDEGRSRGILLQYEQGALQDRKPKKVNGKVVRPKITDGPIKAKDRAKHAFWKMYDANSAASFSKLLYPQPIPSSKRVKTDRPQRTAKINSQNKNADMVKLENEEKKSTREDAFIQKPLDKAEKKSLDALSKDAESIDLAGSSSLIPIALALKGFLHTMAQAYPKSYTHAWGSLDLGQRASELGSNIDVDGEELLGLLAKLPSHKLVSPKSDYKFSFPDTSSKMEEEVDYSKLLTDALSDSEQRSATRDGVTNQYRVGHASGRNNACLIYSLLYHVLGKDATNDQVDQIRDALKDDHDDIANGNTINIYSATGHAVINEINNRYGVLLNVAVVTTRDAPVVPVTQGTTPALVYLMPGHFAPCWRK